MRVPVSTYRLQITADRPLGRAAELVPYLHSLGVDWMYLSPLLAAEPGSDHGYDVIDHGATDGPRGGRAGLARVADAAHSAGLGVLVDVVPNHVGIATPALSVWWWDLLTHGRDSAHAEAFDVDWTAGGGRIRIPVLADGSAQDLAHLEVTDGELRYYDHRFPIAPGTGSGCPQQVHHRQHYELVDWRRADAELNYRRFFAVNTLAGIRVERPEVFAASHIEVAHWVGQGWADGLRIDHPDGLADPGRYLKSLAELIGHRYVLVEKILEPGETLPADWACAGTTGYDALAVLDRLFVDPAGQVALDALDTELRGGAVVDWPAMMASTKQGVADTILESEIRRLARLLPDIHGAAAALAAIAASFAVYRSYLPLGAQYLDQAARTATARRPGLAGSIAAVAQRLSDPDTEVAVRFQQTSGMIMAKGVEDCAFYRWTRLTSLTEVGADPSIFAVSPAQFHRAQDDRLREQPRSMTALSTHDTKRGEDTRARISVLAELADEWAEAVRGWNRRAPLDDPTLAHLIWQAAVGAWPITRDRLQAYALKSAREAGVFTRWTDADQHFESQLTALVDAVYDDPELSADITGWVERVSGPGWSNSWSAKLIQLTGPGVPDVYQGSERGEFSLVDPDNRRPVDHAVSAAVLERLDGGWRPSPDEPEAVKLLLTSRALRARRDEPQRFTDYRPLVATGSAAEHAVVFDRGGSITVATRLPVGLAARGGWGDTRIELPAGNWQNRLSGPDVDAVSGTVRLSELLADLPVALLIKED